MKALVLFVATFLSGSSFSADWKVAYSKAYTFPFGVSQSDPIHLMSEIPAGARLRVEYTGTNPCYITAQRIEAGGYPLYPDAEGVFTVPSTGIRRAVIHAHSAKWSKVVCSETLYVQTAPAPSQMKYLGSYTVGTDASEVIFKLSAVAKVTHFRLEVPAFCDGSLTVSSADTMTEGVWDEANLVDASDRIYEVVGGAAMRISAIRLVLDETPEVACPINFYARVKK